MDPLDLRVLRAPRAPVPERPMPPTQQLMPQVSSIAPTPLDLSRPPPPISIPFSVPPPSFFSIPPPVLYPVQTPAHQRPPHLTIPLFPFPPPPIHNSQPPIATGATGLPGYSRPSTSYYGHQTKPQPGPAAVEEVKPLMKATGENMCGCSHVQERASQQTPKPLPGATGAHRGSNIPLIMTTAEIVGSSSEQEPQPGPAFFGYSCPSTSYYGHQTKPQPGPAAVEEVKPLMKATGENMCGCSHVQERASQQTPKPLPGATGAHRGSNIPLIMTTAENVGSSSEQEPQPGPAFSKKGEPAKPVKKSASNDSSAVPPVAIAGCSRTLRKRKDTGKQDKENEKRFDEILNLLADDDDDDDAEEEVTKGDKESKAPKKGAQPKKGKKVETKAPKQKKLKLSKLLPENESDQDDPEPAEDDDDFEPRKKAKKEVPAAIKFLDRKEDVETICLSEESESDDGETITDTVANLLYESDGMDGVTRQCIIAYFRCYEPEHKSIRRKKLPPLPPVTEEDELLRLINTLQEPIKKKILNLLKEAKLKLNN
ncbi:pollen-specific leucine-rich repeat extensin-like protein 2 [Thrips palmi]|uniref:Pollen-specific leucine-rich repeat extensin-like protein 2 n=1 Tax=Thrips palmi TaxID=161013 RepID=A0A6P8Z1D9_THRPL|nr:pollen-specific leucine-rich repeat extensin-like protein 2 [Thrips palmi]